MNGTAITADCLPPVVEQLLLDVVADGFVLYCCGRRADPTALVACYDWGGYLDLVTIRDFDHITVARVPKDGRIDPFAPEAVVWFYEGPAECALRALLNLVHPEHPDAPATVSPAPPSLHISRGEQRPLTIRPPSPSRVGTRAARLAAAMTGHDRRAGHEDLPPEDPAPRRAR
jgi:hypothetical protein